ncbi:MAG TPA: hypothetical protein VK787_05630 [Puia sp.]|jgi:hypothetical protein|nr:hypothetical protein [Puia sp.]
MKRVTIIFLLFSINSYSQPKNISINYQYFILGTIDDYVGRRVDSSNVNWIDLYAPFEKSLVHFTDSLLLKNNVAHKVVNDLESLHIVSDSIAKKVNSFYEFRNMEQRTLDDGTNMWDTLFSGRLKENIFHDSLEAYSFLLGVYTRFGKKLDTIYRIQFLSPVSKAHFCLNLLTKVGCTNISSDLMEVAPSQNIIYFKPTEKLEKYLTAFEFLKSELNRSLAIYLKQQ